MKVNGEKKKKSTKKKQKSAADRPLLKRGITKMKIRTTPKLTKRKVFLGTPGSRKPTPKKKSPARKGTQQPTRRSPRSTPAPLDLLAPAFPLPPSTSADTTIGMSSITPSRQSTPKGAAEAGVGGKNNNGSFVAASKERKKRPGAVPAGVTPLTPRVLVRPYATKGFFEPPITIDETNSMLVDGDVSVVSPSKAGEKPKRDSGVESGGSSKDATIEDGEIVDLPRDDEEEIVVVKEVVSSKNVAAGPRKVKKTKGSPKKGRLPKMTSRLLDKCKNRFENISRKR